MSTVATGVLTVIAVYKRHETPSARIGVGVLGMGVMLAVGSEFVPNVSAGLAVLVLVTAAFVVGGDAWQGLTAATN